MDKANHMQKLEDTNWTCKPPDWKNASKNREIPTANARSFSKEPSLSAHAMYLEKIKMKWKKDWKLENRAQYGSFEY